MINPKLRLKGKPSVVLTELDSKEAMLLNFETKFFYGLNETAIKIWKLLDGKNSIDDIADIIVKEYDISRKKALNKIEWQIQKLIKAKMIKD